MRTLISVFGMLLLAAACSKDPETTPPPTDLAMPNGDMQPSDLKGADLTSAGVDLTGCRFQFGTTTAIETSSSNRIPLHGGFTDAGSVVTVNMDFSSAVTEVLTVLYEANANCAQAAFSHSIVMNASPPQPGQTMYTAYLPAMAAGTHMCWKIAAATCYPYLTEPPSGQASFDYTTQ